MLLGPRPSLRRILGLRYLTGVPRSPTLARGAPPVARILLASWVLLGLAGCTAPRLTSELRVEPFASLRAAYDRLPQERLEVEVRVDGQPSVVALRRIQGGTQASIRPTLVMQPGLMASGETWRFLAGALEGAFDLLLVDPPGAGGSSVPDPEGAPEHAYGPTWLAAHTLAALEALEASQPRGAQHTSRPASYVLVGHSLGGAVVLRALADGGLRERHAGVLARVRGAVLFNPADIALSTRQEMFVNLTRLTDFEVGVAERLGLLRRRVRMGVLDNAVLGPAHALEDEARRIEDMLGRRPMRRAAQAMLRRFQPLEQDGETTDMDAARRLAVEEGAVSQPVLVLWGTQDRTFAREVGEAVVQRLARARMVELPHAGHSSHQDAAREAASHLRGFVESLAAEPGSP